MKARGQKIPRRGLLAGLAALGAAVIGGRFRKRAAGERPSEPPDRDDAPAPSPGRTPWIGHY